MPTTIQIAIEEHNLKAHLNDSQTAREIASMLPVSVRMSRWGDEYYGSIGADFELEPEARDRMQVGELAYWPTGQALCIFFGPTPASDGPDPVAASPVNPVGTLIDPVEPLKQLGSTVLAQISLAQE